MISDSLSEKITYLLIDTHNHALAKTALRNSQIAFPLKNRLVFSDVEDGWDASELIRIDPINSVQGYCEFLLKHAWKFVKTEFFIVLQYDGFVLNGDCFPETSLDYDYIGAPWPHFDFHKVGNGGFSLRSRRLMQAVEPLLAQQDFSLPEDIVICRKYRRRLERDFAIKFAPVSVAEKFSQELSVCNHPTFGFHGYTLLPLVYRHNLEFLFQHLPPSKNKNKFNEFKAGCQALGIDEMGHNGFMKWCVESRVCQNTQNQLRLG
jgi:hypothetical protein